MMRIGLWRLIAVTRGSFGLSLLDLVEISYPAASIHA
jgi:hypothetical protein